MPGTPRQAGLIASQCHAGAYANRFVVVVDDDIDPADMDKVVWAMCTRFDPREGLETLRGCCRLRSIRWPMAATIRAMRASSSTPASRSSAADTFPIVVRASKEVEDHVRGKFSGVLPRK